MSDGRVRRVAAAVLALVTALMILATLNEPVFYFVALALLFAGPFVSWWTAYDLHKATQESVDLNMESTSLRSRATDAIVLALASTIAAALGFFVFGRAVGIFEAVPRPIFLAGIASAMVLISAPAVDWQRTFRPMIQRRLKQDADDVAGHVLPDREPERTSPEQ